MREKSIDTLLAAAKALKHMGMEDEANEILSQVAQAIDQQAITSPHSGIAVGGVVGMLAGVIVFPGNWFPLGITGAVLGYYISKPYYTKKIADLRDKLVRERMS